MNSALLAALASTALMTGCGLASSREFDMDAVGEALEACTPFTHVYNNPLVGEGAEAVVEGIDEGLCVYRHRMTSTFTVTCRFDEPTRRAVASDMRLHGWRKRTSKPAAASPLRALWPPLKSTGKPIPTP